MADYTPTQGGTIPNTMKTRFKDMGDGTHAQVLDIGRTCSNGTTTIANGAALSDAIDMRGYAGMILTMPAAWTAADIGFYVCATATGTFLPYYDEDGTLVEISSPAASQAMEVPSKLFPAFYVKLWSESGGSDESQGAARSIGYMLKG
jgi:hypothetical protein